MKNHYLIPNLRPKLRNRSTRKERKKIVRFLCSRRHGSRNRCLVKPGRATIPSRHMGWPLEWSSLITGGNEEPTLHKHTHLASRIQRTGGMLMLFVVGVAGTWALIRWRFLYLQRLGPRRHLIKPAQYHIAVNRSNSVKISTFAHQGSWVSARKGLARMRPGESMASANRKSWSLATEAHYWNDLRREAAPSDLQTPANRQKVGECSVTGKNVISEWTM